MENSLSEMYDEVYFIYESKKSIDFFYFPDDFENMNKTENETSKIINDETNKIVIDETDQIVIDETKQQNIISPIEKNESIEGKGLENKNQKFFVYKKLSKFKNDNVFQKYMGHFLSGLISLINILIEKLTKTKEFFRKIDSKVYKYTQKEEMKKFYEMKVREYLEKNNISSKYKKFEINYNEKQIKQLDKFYKGKKEWDEVFKILNSTMRDMHIIYINNIEEYRNKGFSLKTDLDKIRKKTEKNGIDNEYIQIYEDKVKHFHQN
jgi:hypothetical protein